MAMKSLTLSRTYVSPYLSADELLRDLNVVHRPLAANGPGALTGGKLRRLRRAVGVFGFSLATVDAPMTVTGQKELQEHNPMLKRSIRNRFPYLDPLNHVQVELLRHFREGQQEERIRLGIHLSINGIAAGLRNSG